MNKKKAEHIIYAVSRYTDMIPPSGHHLTSLVEHILKIANSKCDHPWQSVKRIDHKAYGNAEYRCDDCEENLRPVKFEVVTTGSEPVEK